MNGFKKWAFNNELIESAILVGSYARGTARPDSDIDFVIICSNPEKMLKNTDWVQVFGTVKSIEIEDWGLVQAVRVYYTDGIEAEFGITDKKWIQIPADPGTRKVLADGFKVIADNSGLFSDFIRRIKLYEVISRQNLPDILA